MAGIDIFNKLDGLYPCKIHSRTVQDLTLPSTLYKIVLYEKE